MPPLPEAIIRVLALWAPLGSHRVWLQAQVWRLGALLVPGARTVTAAWRVMGLAAARRFTHEHRVLNWVTWSARHGSRRRLGGLITRLVPRGPRACVERTTRSNAEVVVRSTPTAATEMRHGLRRRLSSAVSA